MPLAANPRKRLNAKSARKPKAIAREKVSIFARCEIRIHPCDETADINSIRPTQMKAADNSLRFSDDQDKGIGKYDADKSDIRSANENIDIAELKSENRDCKQYQQGSYRTH